MPLISVIIPTYNRPRLLRLTIESVYAQTFSDFEIIVVDDGSLGNENEGLCQEFSKVRFFKIKNSGGPAKPRNVGIKKARGTYLAFLDDDDLWLPTKLEKQLAILENNPTFGLVHSPCEVIDENDKKTSQIIGRLRDKNLKHGDVSLRMIGVFTLMTSSVVIRREIVEMVGGFNEIMPPAGEDTHFWTRCSFVTKFYYLDDPLVLYRRHQSVSEINREQYFELPCYLNSVLKDNFKKERITKKQYSLLRNKVIGRQLKEISAGKIKTLKRLFKLYPFWFLNFENIKIYIISILR